MQGFNMGRYVPPDLEGVASGNQLHGKHALGSRANKSAQGILTVRFEMPFAIWCQSCPKPTIIGQGVRFNAQKKRVGSYYSTPIWSFRMKHAGCDGEIEIRTDPKNTAYEVISGARKRNTGDDEGREPREGEYVITTDQEREALRNSAFASLEKTILDRERLIESNERIRDLAKLSAKHWDDPHAQNQKLRKAFREVRKKAEREAADAEDIKDRMSLQIDLLPASEEDARRAALVDFGRDDNDDRSNEALTKPLFGSAKSTLKERPRLKAEMVAQQRREKLAADVASSARLATDPFLAGGDWKATRTATKLSSAKRKRKGTGDPEEGVPPPKSAQKLTLVDYDSE